MTPVTTTAAYLNPPVTESRGSPHHLERMKVTGSLTDDEASSQPLDQEPDGNAYQS
jgi:hypothetical protein